MPNLSLYAPAAVSTTNPAWYGGLGSFARGYRRSTRAVGGMWAMTFELTQEDFTRNELDDLYANALGCRIVERFASTVSWEGYIEDLRLTRSGGGSYFRSLRPQWCHNYVNVRYSDTVGSTSETGWSENTDSSDQYGRIDWFISLGGCTSTGASDLRARHLDEYAWPRSRRSGSIQVGGEPSSYTGDTLVVTAAGFWHTLNWRYRASSTTDTASALVTTLVGESEFVTAGRIETNSDSLRVDAYPIPQRLGDLIENVIMQGDSTGAIYQGGVYAGRLIRYEPAPTSYSYTIGQGMLLDVAGNEVPLALVEPGFLLYDSDAAVGGEPSGTANVWDDPHYHYVEEIEYTAADLFAGVPEALVLRLRDEEDSTATLELRIRGGNV